jgi:hypothetical protein
MQPALILQSISFKVNDKATQLTPHVSIPPPEENERAETHACRPGFLKLW